MGHTSAGLEACGVLSPSLFAAAAGAHTADADSARSLPRSLHPFKAALRPSPPPHSATAPVGWALDADGALGRARDSTSSSSMSWEYVASDEASAAQHAPYRPWPADKGSQIPAHRKQPAQETSRDASRDSSAQRARSQRAKSSMHPVQTQRAPPTAGGLACLDHTETMRS